MSPFFLSSGRVVANPEVAVDWMEKVSDAQYGAPARDQESSFDAGAKPRPTQGAIGDFDPKLAASQSSCKR